MITFRLLARGDLSTLHHWVQRPHVARWWEHPRTPQDIEAEYLPVIEGRSSTQAYIAHLAQEPIGFIQVYVVEDSGDGWWEGERDPGARGIDQFLADGQRLGQGLGAYARWPSPAHALPARRHNAPMKIERDDLTRPQVHALLEEHLAHMHELSPPESVHALDLSRLRSPDITFWTAWDGAVLLGCGALKQLTPTHGEIKSMRTPQALRRRGAGRAMLAHLIAQARSRGYERLSLETGSQDGFKPAQQLYTAFDFAPCGPFADYRPDPYSVFMTLVL